MTKPAAPDPSTIHLFTDAATWTALAAIAALTDHNRPAVRPAALDVTPFAPSGRAFAAGLDPARPTDQPIPRDARVVAWDQPAQRWASARGLPVRSAPENLPIPAHLLTPRDDARRSLEIAAGAVTAAVPDFAPSRLTTTDAALIAAATGLAGTPTTIVIFSAAPLNRADARSLEKIGKGSRVITTTLPLWRVLAACDIILTYATRETDAATWDDLLRWASAAGVAIARPPRLAEDSRPDQRRFALARTLIRALDRDADALEPAENQAAAASRDETDWRASLIAAIEAL